MCPKERAHLLSVLPMGSHLSPMKPLDPVTSVSLCNNQNLIHCLCAEAGTAILENCLTAWIKV